MSSLPSFIVGEGATGAPYLTFGLPADAAAWLALGLAMVGLGVALRPRCVSAIVAGIERAPERLVLGCLSALSCALSAGYLSHYLQGGPRIVDATSYFLEGRALAAGKIWFEVPEPRAAFHGRFLLASQEGLAVLFPPGFPLVLAFGFALGAPLATGPAIAALLVPASFAVARALGARRTTAYAAAALGVASAALHYHTADTMSHGLAALLLATAFAAGTRPSLRAAALAGAAAGLLLATRPVTGTIVLVLTAFGVRRGAREWLAYALGSAPFVAFFVWHQYTLTGEWLRSGQAAYYAVADGPPGCFRYGFGRGIGCWFEHGDYVRARLPESHGIAQAGSTTLRRLAVHSSDVVNFAPLAALVGVGAWLERGERAGRLALLILAGVIVGYAPFYFEGSYPGGGARFFADVLPLEHALIAIAAARFGRVALLWPLCLFGFAVHTSHQHGALSRREGGRPMFEARELASRAIKTGLVFVATDHGFALGHDPRVRDAHSGLVVARARGDAIDRGLWEALGRPRAYRYRYDPFGSASIPAVDAFIPPDTRRVEGESLYPPARVERGFAHPEVRQSPCVSRERVLRFRATETASPVRVTLSLPPEPTGARGTVTQPDRPAWPELVPAIVIAWSDDADGPSEVRVRAAGTPLEIEWSSSAGRPCRRGLVRGAWPASLELESNGGALDYLEPAATGAGDP